MLLSELFSQTLHDLIDINRSSKWASNPELDIQILIEKALGITRDQFWILKQKPIINQAGLIKFYRYASKLKKHEPVAYIIREKSFYNTNFYVNKSVLIPRPETELLIEKALDIINFPIRILDIGAGSGNISITLALETGSTVVAVENDKNSVRVLRRNIETHGIAEKVIVEQSDLFTRKKWTFDMIVSNPPYVSEREWNQLPPQVRDYEPRGALVAGKSGYEIIERIITGSKKYLNPDGWLLIEIGFRQKKRVEQLLRRADFQHIHFLDDYSKIPRLACARA